MAHVDYVRTLVDNMGDKEFCTQDIADLMSDYWVQNRVRSCGPHDSTKAYYYLSKLAKWGYVIKTRTAKSNKNGYVVAYWRRAE